MTLTDPEYSRLCLVPAVEATVDGETITAPMWYDEDRLQAWSGNTFPREEFSNLYSAYLQQNPDVDRFYVVKFHGNGDEAWNALNEMAVTFECLVLTEHEHNAADVLSTLFPDSPRSGSGWDSAFSAQIPSSE